MVHWDHFHLLFLNLLPNPYRAFKYQNVRKWTLPFSRLTCHRACHRNQWQLVHTESVDFTS